jgi:hypothetical protein
MLGFDLAQGVGSAQGVGGASKTGHCAEGAPAETLARCLAPPRPVRRIAALSRRCPPARASAAGPPVNGALSVLRLPVRLSVECPGATVQIGARGRLPLDPGARRVVTAENQAWLEIDAADRLAADAVHPHHLAAFRGEQSRALSDGSGRVVAGPLGLAGVPGDNKLLCLSVAQTHLAANQLAAVGKVAGGQLGVVVIEPVDFVQGGLSGRGRPSSRARALVDNFSQKGSPLHLRTTSGTSLMGFI